jgi:hypothetical protein
MRGEGAAPTGIQIPQGLLGRSDRVGKAESSKRVLEAVEPGQRGSGSFDLKRQRRDGPVYVGISSRRDVAPESLREARTR